MAKANLRRRVRRARVTSYVMATLMAASCSSASDGPNGPPPLTNSIVFTSDFTDAAQVYVMNADGTNVRALTDIPGYKIDPAVSPDGRKIAFALGANVYEQATVIYIMNSDGSDLKQLTHSSDLDRNPSFSSDGSEIVFSRSHFDSASIYKMRTDGTHLVNMIHHGVNLNAVWRPGARSILFVSDRDHLGGINSEIYQSDALGLSIRPLVSGFDPAWSPSGTKFLFKRDGQIWISDTPDGTHVRQLTNFLSSYYSPSWSPDERTIIFTSIAGGSYEIFSVDATDGSGPQQITSGFYQNIFGVTFTRH
jgi:TolB protein